MATLTASKMVKLFKDPEWGDMKDHVYVKGKNLIHVDTFYYGEAKALGQLVDSWKSGGHNHSWWKQHHNADIRIVSTFSEIFAMGRHKKLTSDGIVGVELKIVSGEDKPINEAKLTKDDLIHKVIDAALRDPKSGQSKTSVDGLLHYIKSAGGDSITKGDIIKHAKKMSGITVQGGNLISDVTEDLGLSFGSRGGGMGTNSVQNYDHFHVDQTDDWEEEYEKTELDLKIGTDDMSKDVKENVNEVFNGTPNKNDGNDILRWLKTSGMLAGIKSGKYKARDIAKGMTEDVGRPVKIDWVIGALKLVGMDIKENQVDENGILYKAGVKKYGKEGMTKIQSAAGKGEGHEEIGKIKDKYEKGKKDESVNEDKESEVKKKTLKALEDWYNKSSSSPSLFDLAKISNMKTDHLQSVLKTNKTAQSAMKALWSESVDEATKKNVGAAADALSFITDQMKKHAGFYMKAKKDQDVKEMSKHLMHLKAFTNQKKQLEKALDVAISGLDKDVELAANESVLRSIIRNKIREEI